MDGLAQIDAWVIAAILAKALDYATSLIAVGGPVFIVAFRWAPEEVLRVARRGAVAAALLGLLVLVLRFGIRSARLSGTGLEGMTDPIMLALIWDSPLGSAAVVRALGLFCVLAVVGKGVLATLIAVCGSVFVAVSYTQVGHSLNNPRWLLAGLLSLHLLVAAFWVAALAPLHRATRLDAGHMLLHRFGVVATGAVPLLILVGLLFAWRMTGSFTALVSTAYGWVLLSKVALVAGLLGFAALNKLRLVPGLAAGTDGTAARLRMSIRWEAVVVGAILLATATLTSITTPPVNL